MQKKLKRETAERADKGSVSAFSAFSPSHFFLFHSSTTILLQAQTIAKKILALCRPVLYDRQTPTVGKRLMAPRNETIGKMNQCAFFNFKIYLDMI